MQDGDSYFYGGVGFCIALLITVFAILLLTGCDVSCHGCP